MQYNNYLPYNNMHLAHSKHIRSKIQDLYKGLASGKRQETFSPLSYCISILFLNLEHRKI
jgi:hypothetical protein